MNTYRAIVRIEHMGGDEVKPYTVTASTEESALLKINGAVFDDIDFAELLSVAIGDIFKM